MDKGIYTALSGGIAKSHELELIANNLANANTPGFKRDTGTFNEYLTEFRRNDSVEGVKREISAAAGMDTRPTGDKSFVEMDGVYTDFRQGTLERTGRPLDLGLEGKGFFEVWTPSGIRYTRQGSFSVSNDGHLVNASGYPVLAKPARVDGAANTVSGARGDGAANTDGAPTPADQPTDVTRPPVERFINIKGTEVRVTPEGNVLQDGQPVAALSVQEFHETQWLEKVGNSLFRNTHPDNVKPTTADTRVHQGFMEGSNVNAVTEMTRLIEATRAYESHMQAIKTYQEIDARSVTDIARGR